MAEEEAPGESAAAPQDLTPMEHFLRAEAALTRLHSGESPRRDQSSPDAKGLIDVAIRHLRAALLAAPTPSPLYTFEYAHALGHAGDPGDELEALVEAIRTHWPLSARGRNHLAMAFASKDPVRSAELAREAIDLDPGLPTAHTTLGVALASQGDLDGAIAAYDHAIAIDSELAAVHYDRALALRKKADLRGAVQGYREALRIDPEDAAVWNNLGSVLSRLGDLEGEMAALAEGVRLDPDDPAGHLNLARALQFGGQIERALEEMRRGHQLGSSQPGWSLPSARWVRDLEALITDRDHLDAWLEGTSEEPPLLERARLAESAYAMGRCELCAGLLGDLFAEHPELADDTIGGFRTTAAYAAAWMGRGTGAEARGWRARAVEWLVEELAGLEALLVEDASQAPAVARTLERWRENPGLLPILQEELPADADASEREVTHELALRVGELASELRESR